MVFDVCQVGVDAASVSEIHYIEDVLLCDTVMFLNENWLRFFFLVDVRCIV